MLGVGKNNWKAEIASFSIMFGTQLVFNLNDLMNTPESFPTVWFIAKAFTSSLVATLIFAGYNRIKYADAEIVKKEGNGT